MRNLDPRRFDRLLGLALVPCALDSQSESPCSNSVRCFLSSCSVSSATLSSWVLVADADLPRGLGEPGVGGVAMDLSSGIWDGVVVTDAGGVALSISHSLQGQP